MNTSDNYKAYLTESIRKDLLGILAYIEEVYGYNPGITSQESGVRYKLKRQMDQPVIDADESVNSLAELEKKVSECKKCGLHLTRKNTVFGKGSDKIKLVIIGEAPGAEEDEKGEPFVGRAGQLLTKMLTAIDISREDIFICNVLKCRPPGNRDPLPEEIAECSVYLDLQLKFLKPDYILALGRIAAMRLLGKQSTMKEFRESDHSYKGIPVLVTYHPSALLRNPNWKYPAWDDLKRLKDLLEGQNG